MLSRYSAHAHERAADAYDDADATSASSAASSSSHHGHTSAPRSSASRSMLSSPRLFSPLSGSSATSLEHEHDPDAASDAGSLSPAPSVYSLTESLRAASYKWEHGRTINNYCDVYHLPADAEEWERLDMQHHMFKIVMGEYAPPFRQIMADDDPTHRKACLDLGSGSGAWIVDVAREFPNSRCVSVDLVPMAEHVTIPPNLRVEIDDINLGLEHFFGEFDAVHARLISSGIKDYYRLVDDAARVLRPRGIAEFTEFDFRVYDAHYRPITPPRVEVYGPHVRELPPGAGGASMSSHPPPRPSHSGSRTSNSSTHHPESPWVARWLTAAGRAARQRGGHIDAAALLHRWVREHPAYEDAVYREFWLPYGPWMRGRPEFVKLPCYDALCRVGDIMSVDIQAFLKAGRPLLLGSGLSEELVDDLEYAATMEVRDCEIPMWLKVQNVYARRKGT